MTMYRESTPSKNREKYEPLIRPSSASGKLQTYSSKNVLESVRPSTAAVHRTSSNYVAPKSQGRGDIPAGIQDVSIKHGRRLTLGEVDGIGDKAQILTRLNTPLSSSGKIKIEERITLEQLHKIKTAFEEADADGSGTLDIDEFKLVVKNSLGVKGRNEEQIIALFMKIDSSSDGEIDWDEFCTYMQLEYAEKEEAFLRSKQVMFTIPPISTANPHHKSPVLKILHIGDSTFMCCSQEGLITFWSNDLKLKRSKSVAADSNGASFSIKPSMWVTDISTLPAHNKIVLSTGDREIHFYELSTFEFYCQIAGLDTVPLCMDICEIDSDQCIITYGDDQGAVSILEINKLGESLRSWKKAPLINGIPTVQLQDIAKEKHIFFIKWKVHDDWITQLRYYHELRSVVSSCNSTDSALVRGCTKPSTALENISSGNLTRVLSSRTSRTGHRPHGRNAMEGQKRQDSDQSVFRVYKGVRTFDFCSERNIIVTGGMDRILRLWNPYMPHKPTGNLRGHNTPILFVAISGVDDRIFSVSSDKVVKIWDLVEQTPLVTLSPKLHKIRGDILACTYTDSCKALAIVTDHISLLKICQRVKIQVEMPTTHSEPVTCIGYNASFNHVITCSEGSVVKLWDFDTGFSMFEFNKAHGDMAITCMSFDTTGRRLITGGRDGAIRIWNYNNGHCLRTLIPEDSQEEITDCLYLEVNKNRYIAGVGWDRKIHIYPDDTQDFRHVQRPENRWRNYDKHGHKDDIVAIAYGQPNLLASVSYEGIINVWNFVSGNIACSLPFPETSVGDFEWTSGSEDADSGNESSSADQAVNKIIFISKRIPEKTSASLIAGCADGTLMFWNVNDRRMHARCSVTKRKMPITTISLTEDEKLLYVGDDTGYVRVWDIEQYALTASSQVLQKPPPLRRSWRAHVQRLTSLAVVEKHEMILTSSTDHTVRIWSAKAQCVGTFGQKKAWDLFDESTWLHPMVPQEVLFDPLSMPDHPILQERNSLMEVVHAESLEPSDSEDEQSTATDLEQITEKGAMLSPHPSGAKATSRRKASFQATLKPSSRRSSGMWVGGGDMWKKRLSRRLSRASFASQEGFYKNEEQILLNDVRRTMTKSAGKRLRHEKLLWHQHQMKMHLDASSHAFQSLKCFDLQEAPEIPSVQPRVVKYADNTHAQSDIEEVEEKST